MAISVVANASNTSGSVAGGTGVTVTHGFTLADGDVLYAFVGRGTANLGVSPDLISAFACSGWTELSGSFVQNSAGNDRAGSVLRKVITNAAGEPSSYTFTATGDTNTMAQAVVIVQLRGVDTTTPEDVALPTPSTITNDFTPASPAITTTTDGALVLVGHMASFGASEASTGITFGAPSGYTLVGSGSVASNGTSSPRDVSLAVAYKSVTTASTETPGSFTHSPDDSTREGIAWTVAVRPATGPVDKASSDSGAGTDASATSATLTATETGASVEAASVAVSAADTGSGSDAQAITASLSATETGAGADTSGSTDVGASETASGADASVSSATLTAADAAAGADAGTTDQSTSVSAEDTTTGTDASSIAATTSASEAATAVDAGTIAASLASSDTATATEAALIQALYQAGDTGAGVELAVVTATFTATDTATSVDAGSVVDTSAAPLAVGITARARPLTPTAEGASLQPVASAQPLTPTAEVR